jgi:shikimate dehydrogenase
VAFDVVYRPRATPFLVAASRAKVRSEDGLGMLIEQAGLSLQHWIGVAPPLDVLRRAAESELSRDHY